MIDLAKRRYAKFSEIVGIFFWFDLLFLLETIIRHLSTNNHGFIYDIVL